MGRAKQALECPEPPDTKRQLEELAVRCRDAGIPCTPQRRLVLETVLALDTHPTADEVLERIGTRRRRISRATVFRTLESLVELGLLQKTSHAGRGVRYDRIAEPHHHLVCVRCERMIDIVDPRLDVLRVPDTSALGFEVSELRVQLRGVCKQCLKEKRS